MSLCVCVSVEHLLLKKHVSCCGKETSKEKTAVELDKEQMTKAERHNEPAGIKCRPISPTDFYPKCTYEWFVFILSSTVSSIHKRWGTWILRRRPQFWIVFTTTGSFHLTQKDVSVFSAFWLVKQKRSQRSTLMFNLAGAIQSVPLWNHCEFEHNRDLYLQFYTYFTDLDQFTRLVTSTAYSGPLHVSTHWVIFKHHFSVHIL